MNAAEVVTVQHLVKRYGNVLAINDVFFSIREGYQLLEQKALLRTEREDLRHLLRRI